MNVRLLREPAVSMALVSALLQVVSVFVLSLNDEQQGVLNAGFATLFGFITAAMVSVDAALPLLGGLFQAVISIGTAFGFELNPEAQTALMAVVAALVGMFVRTQVVPNVTESVHGSRH